MNIIKLMVIYFIRILLCLLLVIYGYDKLNNTSFIEEIEQYDLFNDTMIYLIASILPWIEISIGLLILLPPYISQSFRFYVHFIYLLLMISFILILFKGKSLGINDCGCGTSINPLDVWSKHLWTWYSKEIIPSVNASILRNIIAIFLLFISIHFTRKNHI